MQSIRDIKRKARLDLHNAMRVKVLYLATPAATPVSVYARIHGKWDAVAMETSGIGKPVARQDRPTKLVFLLSELTSAGISLQRKGIVSVEPGEAYVLDNAEAPDLITVTWNVTQLRGSDLDGLPVPTGA